jgi:hypothetical protein
VGARRELKEARNELTEGLGKNARPTLLNGGLSDTHALPSRRGEARGERREALRTPTREGRGKKKEKVTYHGK